MYDKIDIVIPVNDTSNIKYTDLKFALRSIEQNLYNYNNIYLIGNIPKLFKNVICVPYNQSDKDFDKEKNILNKILLCCWYDKISDNFLMANDDHFFLQQTDALNFPNYHNGELEKNQYKNTYSYTINNTIRFLDKYGSRKLNFDVHTPIVYNKKTFKEIFQNINLPRYGYCIKSIYGNMANIDAEYIEDCKINTSISYQEAKELCIKRPIISCGDAAMMSGLKEYLGDIFINKSIFEL